MARRHLHIVLMCLFLASAGHAQSERQITLAIQPASKLWLTGTSTMHDYTARTSTVKGTVVVDSAMYAGAAGSQSTYLRKVEISIPVNTLTSGDEKLDDTMYDALEAEDHPAITYVMTGDSIISATHDTLKVKTTGKLTVAGKEKAIDMMVTVLQNKDGTVRVTGHKDLLMTDFGVDPPTFMFVITTDDKVVIHFSMLFQRHSIDQQ